MNYPEPNYVRVYFKREGDPREDVIEVPYGSAEQHVRPELITHTEPFWKPTE